MSHRLFPLRSNTLRNACLLFVLLLAFTGCGGMPGNVENHSPVQGKATASVVQASLGYVWGASGPGLRRILGVPGAASLGPANYASGYVSAVTQRNASHALLTRTDGQVAVAGLTEGSVRVIAPRLSSRQQINLSPSGSAAIVYSVDRSTLLLITGLPNSINVQTVPLANKKSLISAVVGDSGLLLLAFAGAEGPELTWMYRDGSMKPVMTVSRLGSLQFLLARDEALVADAGKDTVWLAKGAVDGSAPARLAGAAEGVKNPAAVAASANGRWAIITNRNQGTVLRVDLSHQEPVARVTCSCNPSELAPLTGNAVFRLTSGDSRPLWIFDGDSASPRIVFLPAADQK